MRVPAILAVVFSASILLGCQIGVLPIIAHHFSDVFFSSSSKENLLIIVLPCVVAAMSAIAGWLSDTVGRRQWILLGVACLAVGGVETAIAETLFELILGRILVGIGAGFVAVILPLYLVELAPKARRGQWVALNCMAINMGIFLSSLMGGLFVEHHTWRFALMLSALPGVLLYLACLYLPESPRWLLFNGQQGKAGKLLIRLFGSKQAMSIINQMDAVNHRQIYQHVRLWSMQGLRLLLVGLLINIFSQALGVHAVIAYSALVLEKMSFQDHFIQLAANMFIAFILMITSFLAAHLLDCVSRRKTLLIGLFGIISSLIIINLSVRYVGSSQLQSWIILSSVIVFLVSQGCSLTPVASLLAAEIFPQSLRGIGMGLSVAAGWATNVIIASAFPHLLSEYGAGVAFFIFLIFAVIAWSWSYFNVPETINLSLEQLEAQFNDSPTVTETAHDLLDLEIAQA